MQNRKREIHKENHCNNCKYRGTKDCPFEGEKYEQFEIESLCPVYRRLERESKKKNDIENCTHCNRQGRCPLEKCSPGVRAALCPLNLAAFSDGSEPLRETDLRNFIEERLN